MKIFFSKYTLKRKLKPNAQVDSLLQNGALIKIQDNDGSVGYADLCPWPELGDLPLEQELFLAGPLFQRSLVLARKDLEARKNQIKLSYSVNSHDLIADLKQLNSQSHVKIKIGPNNYINVANSLNDKKQSLTCIRLDFNSSLNLQQCLEFLNLLDQDVIKKIECIEDPIRFNHDQWMILSKIVTIAKDFEKADWPVSIWKPSRLDKPQQTILYCTSAMDHPVGVKHGMIEATTHFPNVVHGFNTLNLFEPTDFHFQFNEDTGYGIGFTELLESQNWQPYINFNLSDQSQILESTYKNKVELSYSELPTHLQKKYFLIESSGSTKTTNESNTFFALSKESILNSAHRIVNHFRLENKNWGCLLPLFHVSGLGIWTRACISGGHVYFNSWKNFSVDWVIDNKIQVMSMVPTQIYDLVSKRIHCPECVDIVFVGGSALSTDLAEEAFKLGWPIVMTFGMTETASMIAYKKNSDEDFFLPIGFDTFFTASSDDFLQIHCSSLADYKIKRIDDQLEFEKINQPMVTQDRVELIDNSFRFLGRDSDFIKINSEGISLSFVRQNLEKILLENNLSIHDALLIPFINQRTGYDIVLVHKLNKDIASHIIHVFNSQVKGVEKIRGHLFWNDEFETTSIGKISYAKIKSRIEESQLKYETISNSIF